MRKRKLQGGKQDIAGTKVEDPRTKDWIVELNAASKALALRWLRAAREGIDGTRYSRLLQGSGSLSFPSVGAPFR